MNGELILMGDLILFAGMPALVLFTVLYGFRSKWRETLAGRSVFYLAAALTAIVVLVVWSRVSDQLNLPMPFREYIRIGVYTFTTGALWWLLLTLLRYQRLDRKAKREDDDKPQP